MLCKVVIRCEFKFPANHGTILAYDVTKRSSFNNVRNWVKEIDGHNTEGLTKVILANKCDLPGREISKSDGEQLAAEIGVEHIEVSAKTGDSI